MGCQCSRSLQDRTKTTKFKETNVGLLDVHLTNGKLYEKSLYNHGGQQAQVFFRIQVSNQEYISRLCSNFCSEGFFNSYFSFFINSNYRADGRILQVQLFRKLEKSGNESLGKGSVDISKVVEKNETNREVKCIMMNKNDPLGYVNCVLGFNALEFKRVSFRFESFILRKYRHMVHSLKVEVLLGQESLFTSVCEDKPCKPSSWTGEILSFKVPNLLKFGIIRLYDNGKSLGQTVIKIQQLLKANQNQQLVCFSQLYDSENNEVGSIKYSMILGNEPKFINEDNKSVKYTNLQINVSRAQKSPHLMKNSSSTRSNSGVQIVFKSKDSPQKLLEDVDNELFDKNFGSAQYMKGSMTHFSVFSIEDLSKLDKQEEK